MTDLILVVDESGAKGYSDQPEKYFGETGVMAGFLFHKDEHDKHQANLTNLRNQFVIDGKLHITDLETDQKKKLCEKIIKYLVDNEVICVFEAIYSEGFYKAGQDKLETLNKSKKQRVSTVKLSGNDKKELLHAQLFKGVFAKAVNYGLDFIEGDFSLLVKTDHVDDGVFSKLTDSANEFLNFGKPKKTKKTGWNPDLKQKVEGSIEFTVSDPHNMLDDLSDFVYEIQREDSEFTLVADVLANSIYRHLKLRSQNGTTRPLNSENSIPKNMEDIYFFGIAPDGEAPYFTDAIFGHPLEKI